MSKFSARELLGKQEAGYGVGRPVVRWRTGQLHRIGRGGDSVAFQNVEWDEWPRARALFTYRLLGGKVHSAGRVQDVRVLDPRMVDFRAGGAEYRLTETTQEV